MTCKVPFDKSASVSSVALSIKPLSESSLEPPDGQSSKPNGGPADVTCEVP